MKTKTIVTVALLGFVAVSLGWLIFKQGLDNKTQAATNPPAAEKPATPTPAQPPATNANPSQGQEQKRVATTNPPAAEKPAPPAPRPDRVIVYYLHTTQRCPTCHKLELYTKEAIEGGFAQEIADGRLVFNVLNVDEQPNAHFIDDYKLSTKSVVMAEMKNDQQAQWKNLPEIWELVGNKEAFIKFIQDQAKLYLQSSQAQDSKPAAASTPPAAENPATPGAEPQPASNATPSATSPKPDPVIVYYLHTTQRCPTCHKLELYTKEAIEGGFVQELADGRLVFRVLNVDEPPNAHFIDDYQLSTKSVVMVKMKEGKQAEWKNLPEIWELVGNKKAFIKFIQDQAKLYLQGK